MTKDTMREDYNDMADALRYSLEVRKWCDWFDKQPWYYRWWYRKKMWFKRVFNL